MKRKNRKNKNRFWTAAECMDAKHSREARRRIVAGCIASGALRRA